jgi:hypothetical protein
LATNVECAFGQWITRRAYCRSRRQVREFAPDVN